MSEITTTRANALVDPALRVWHAEIPIYLFLGGLVAGLMVLAGAWRLRPPRAAAAPASPALALLPWAAPVLLTLGMLFLWLDLENRWNAWRFYLTFRPASPMSWGSWILLAVYPAGIATAWLGTPARRRETVLARLPRLAGADAWLRRRARGIAWATIVLGAALGVYTGVLLGTMAARPLWNSAVLGPLFLVSGLSGAAALLLLSPLHHRERVALRRLDLGLIVVECVLLALWLIALASGSEASRAAAGLLLGGPYTAAFWTLVVALGIVTPVAAEWIEARHGLAPGRVPAALVLAGGFALRWIVVFAGQDSSAAVVAALR